MPDREQMTPEVSVYPASVVRQYAERIAALERENRVYGAAIDGLEAENARLRSAIQHAVELLIAGKPTGAALEAVRILESRRYLIGEHGVLAQRLADGAREALAGAPDAPDAQEGGE